MGYAAHRAWSAGSISSSLTTTTRHAATVYSAQLALNLLWTPLFFGLKKPVLALLDLVALLGANVYLASLWAEIDPVASYCLYPYLGWLGFATYLCAGVGSLNGWNLTPRPKAA